MRITQHASRITFLAIRSPSSNLPFNSAICYKPCFAVSAISHL